MFLLHRTLFSCLDAVYPFTRLQPDTALHPIGRKIKCELMSMIVLAPYLEADLRRKWAPMITATDASVVFVLARRLPLVLRKLHVMSGDWRRLRGLMYVLLGTGVPLTSRRSCDWALSSPA